VMLVSLFGGVETFGPIGLILGPVIASLALAVLRTYAGDLLACRLADAER
jgi:predicted PurR-regulated permease PerM